MVDGFQFFLDEGEVGGVVANGDALGFRRFCHAVDADGQVLFVEGDEAGVVHGEHAGGKVVFHQLAVGVLVAVDFFDFGKEIAAILHQAVHVDGDDVNRTGGHAARAEAVGEGAVFDGVAQAAAGGERVGVVGLVDEEGVACGEFARDVVGKGAIFAAAVFGEHGDGDDREGEDGALALGVEPFEEVVLQRGDALPVRAAEVGEDEVAEHGVEVVLVVDGDVPEGALVAARGGGLVERIDDVLQVVGDVLFMRAQVVVAIVLAREVVKIGEKFDGGDRPGKLRADGKDEVHE